MAEYSKHIEAAFRKLICYRFFGTDEVAPSYYTQEITADGVQGCFKSSQTFCKAVGDSQNFVKKLAKILKEKGFYDVKITRHVDPTDTFEENRPTLTFTAPNTLESVQILEKIYRDNVIENVRASLQVDIKAAGDELKKLLGRVVGDKALADIRASLNVGGKTK